MSRGIWSLGIPGKPVPSVILSHPQINGVVLRLKWNDLEPEQGRLNDSLIASTLALCSANGKQVKLHLHAGINSPDWISRPFTFVDGVNWLADDPAQIPIPWDTNYQNDICETIGELGKRFAGHPALACVALDGIHGLTEETSLPRGQGKGSQSNDVDLWRVGYGYTRTRLLSAFQVITDQWARQFPDCSLALEIVAAGLPPIDAAGAVLKTSKGEIQPGDGQANLDLIDLCSRRYGPRVVVQNNGLSPKWHSPQVADAAKAKITTAYQMCWRVTPDPLDLQQRWKRMAGIRNPEDPASNLREACDRGILAGAKALEIYQPDFVNELLQGVIVEARKKLLA